MRSPIRRIIKFSSISMIVSLMIFIVACGSLDSSGGTGSTITSADNVTFKEGESGTFTVTATGEPAPTFGLTGTLPWHVTFDDHTGILSGIPVFGTSGTYPLSIIASNAINSQKFTLTVVAAPKALIVKGTSPYDTVVANLTSIMKAAIINVSDSTVVPTSSLSGYAQIWDVRYDNTTALTVDEITNYTTYVKGGGTLVLIGENTSYDIRNNSIISLISALGGGSITISGEASNTETVQSPFDSPNPITTVSYDYSAYAGDPGNGAFITERAGGTTGSALYFAKGALSEATAGRLMVVFDINWMYWKQLDPLDPNDKYINTDFGKLMDNMVRLP